LNRDTELRGSSDPRVQSATLVDEAAEKPSRAPYLHIRWDNTLNLPATLSVLGLLAAVFIGVGTNRERIVSHSESLRALDRRDEAIVARLERLEAGVNLLPERIARLEQQQAIDSAALTRIEGKLDREMDAAPSPIRSATARRRNAER